ncbi:MAG: hypothetical protein SPL79_05045 [Sphaerochaetaceae bacterium]|nr:hypothetical protein [Sphaerochaetaceae bacterium]
MMLTYNDILSQKNRHAYMADGRKAVEALHLAPETLARLCQSARFSGVSPESLVIATIEARFGGRA